ncbi:PREDICTED: organic cation transporter protein [Bactrocera latifrons]|uniref:Organic cation transporter protein n=2 Tax=Bactrocera latifrons TaxID=174628 RepID=A0A0K8UQD0_BACLA|nr:PREDICTED: organic cation transporter protein [Bactrocera latifrons]XP_018799069.1 PREDICTED: organic cation transporter protein [Bactrocera latifrons]XP_018799071.1 PREDICTED: organic cation transporter protein [Bactrocera latifrons]
MAVDYVLEDLMGKLGEFGRYQAIQFFLQVLSGLTAGLHLLSLVTIAAVPEHRCFIEGIDNSSYSYTPWNSSDILAAIPLKPTGELDNCHMYDAQNNTVACTSYVYDRTYYQDTRAIDWNLVCDRRWLGSVAQTVLMLGVFTGAVTLGGLADKVGRKTVFCWSALLQLVIGVAVAFIPEYFSFMAARFFLGLFGSAGSYICGFVLTMELVGASKRTVCGITFQTVFAGGIMLVAGWGALIKDRQLLQIIYGLHGLLFIGHWWWLDESPRWLWMQGRAEEAVDIVIRGLRINGSGIPVDKNYYVQKAKQQTAAEEKPSAGLGGLFSTPNLRMKTLNVCLCWFANSLVYYGLSLSAGKLYGNPFLILFVMGLVEFPSYFTIMVVLDRLGRRPITSTLMIAGGLCCIVTAFIAQGSNTSTGIVMMGKLFIAGSFAVIYNYSAELFPTVVRNSAMGLGSMCARFSGALTPLITLLDSFDPKIPAVVFGIISLISGFWVMFLPETMNQPMPESLEDGENFGKGDTWFTQCAGRKSRRASNYPEDPEQMVPLKTIQK